ADRITLTANGAAVRTALTLANGDARAILTPSTPLKAATIYTVTVGAVADLSGNPIAAPVVTQFTTGNSVDLVAPTVTAVTPSNGAQNVALDATVQLTFSERINRLSV